MTFTGSLTSINAALNNLKYTPTTNFTGMAGISISVNDSGVAISGGVTSSSSLLPIYVAPIEIAPLVLVPATQSVNENQSITFTSSGGNPNAITVSSIDPTKNLQVTITATNGVLSLNGDLSGVSTISNNSITNSSSITFVGTASTINNALNNLLFKPNSGFYGTANISLTCSDLIASNSSNFNITVSPVLLPPTVIMPGENTATSIANNSVLTFTGSNLISISDQNSGVTTITQDIVVNNGTVTLSSITGITFVNNTMNGTNHITFVGTQAAINNVLNNAIFTPQSGFSGTAIITMTTTDNLNATATSVMDVGVYPASFAPVNSVPYNSTVTNQQPIVFSVANNNAITVSDPIASSNNFDVQVTVSVGTGGGTLSIPSTVGINIANGYSATNASTIVFTGKIADVNNALNGLIYIPQNVGLSSISISTNNYFTTTATNISVNITTAAVTNSLTNAPVNVMPYII
ncbi:MAG: hypothetical protein ACR2HS_03565, partial [Gammaproteobacteria bacterium]